MTKLNIAQHLLAALIEIMNRLAQHPLYLGDDATEDIMREGGDAAEITRLHRIARDAIAQVEKINKFGS